MRNSNPHFLPTTGSSVRRLRLRRTRRFTIISSQERPVTAGLPRATSILRGSLQICAPATCARPMNAQSPTANGSRLFAIARANHWNWNSFRTSRSMMITRFCRLTDSLTDFASAFGADNPLVKQVLAGKSPHARAVELVSGTKLKDASVRKDLYGKDAGALRGVARSDDRSR